MVVDEWRGTYGDGSDIVCDTAGGICPWGFANGNDVEELNISAAATTLMVRGESDSTPLVISLSDLYVHFSLCCHHVATT